MTFPSSCSKIQQPGQTRDDTNRSNSPLCTPWDTTSHFGLATVGTAADAENKKMNPKDTTTKTFSSGMTSLLGVMLTPNLGFIWGSCLTRAFFCFTSWPLTQPAGVKRLAGRAGLHPQSRGSSQAGRGDFGQPVRPEPSNRSALTPQRPLES